jgi:hypothetical protein
MITIIATPTEARGLQDGTVTLLLRLVVPKMTTPKLPPLTMEPWLIDGVQETDDNGHPCWIGTHPEYPTDKWFSCDYGVGDVVPVKETWNAYDVGWDDWCGGWEIGYPLDTIPKEKPTRVALFYAADGDDGPWRSSTTMPLWAVRTHVRVTSVACVRACDLTDEQVIAAGIFDIRWSRVDNNLRKCLAEHMARLHGPDAMTLWVWAIGVERCDA